MSIMSETSIGTPSNIEVLLHYHCSVEPHSRYDAPAVKSAIEAFLRMGVLEKDPDSGLQHVYVTTALGRAWVKALCNTPLPKLMFIDELGRVIE